MSSLALASCQRTYTPSIWSSHLHGSPNQRIFHLYTQSSPADHSRRTRDFLRSSNAHRRPKRHCHLHLPTRVGLSSSSSPSVLSCSLCVPIQYSEHTVTQSSFDSPCLPLQGGFSSGAIQVLSGNTSSPNNTQWDLQITDPSNRKSPHWNIISQYNNYKQRYGSSAKSQVQSRIVDQEWSGETTFNTSNISPT
jgi:hypothetical protein